MKRIEKTIWMKIFPTYTKQIFIAIGVLTILLGIQMLKGDQIEPVDMIERPDFYEAGTKYKLYYQTDDETIESIDVNVRSKKASLEEMEKYLTENQISFEEEFRQRYNQKEAEDVQELETIDGAIELTNTYKKCELKFFTEEIKEIDDQGWVAPEYLDKTVVLPYSIKYQKAEKKGTVQIYIRSSHVSEDYMKKYEKYQLAMMIQLLELDNSEERIILPEEEIKFYKTYFPVEKGKYIAYIFLFILSFSMLSHYEVRHQSEVFEKEKRIQLMYFLNNFILMFHSGLTIQKSFYLSVDNRVQTLEQGNKMKQYFEKWQIMIQQEREFHEIISDFQKCFSIIEGRRFCRLILQNLRQGDHHLTIQLATLSETMWDQRIRHARKESEKASSKLVFPMLIIFIVILIITIVPSFMEVNMM